jgi:hypothetical protein
VGMRRILAEAHDSSVCGDKGRRGDTPIQPEGSQLCLAIHDKIHLRLSIKLMSRIPATAPNGNS